MYRTSSKPLRRASNSSTVFAGSNAEEAKALVERMKRDRTHTNRSNGQRVRQARERLYGKNSHLVTVRRIEGWAA